MAEEEQAAARRDRLIAAADPSALTTSALLHEVENLKEQLVTQIAGEIKALDARITAIDKATTVFEQNLTRVPTEVQKAVSNLEKLHDTRFSGVEQQLKLGTEVTQTRFDGMDRALKLLQDIADKLPQRIDEKIGSLKELHDGQFSGVQTQFDERDTRTEQIAKLSETAINAALAAAKEAASKQAEASGLAAEKSERQFTKLMDQLQDLLSANTTALDGKIADVKERVARIESGGVGAKEMRAETHSSSAFILAIVVALISFVGLMVSLFMRTPGH